MLNECICSNCNTSFVLKQETPNGWYACPECGVPLSVKNQQGAQQLIALEESAPPAPTELQEPGYRYPLLDPANIKEGPIRIGGDARIAGDIHWSADFVPNDEGEEHWFDFHGRTTFKHRTVPGGSPERVIQRTPPDSQQTPTRQTPRYADPKQPVPGHVSGSILEKRELDQVELHRDLYAMFILIFVIVCVIEMLF